MQKMKKFWMPPGLAGVHELILTMPNGYDAQIGVDVVLSGGQIQRIGLARALYKNPVLIVLDEPNSNLDVEGDQALAKAIIAMRKKGSIVIVMAHRPSAIAAVNKVLMLKDGAQIEFGDKQDVINKVTQKTCLLYTSPSPRDATLSRMPSSA